MKRISFTKHFLTFSLVFYTWLVSPAQYLPSPATYPGTTIVNYIRSWDGQAPETDPANLVTRPLRDVGQRTRYLDGLGRDLQTIIRQGALATGQSPVDVVMPSVYDEMGREVYKFLPSSASSLGTNTSVNDGNFKLNPFDQQVSFYNTLLFGQSGETNVGPNQLTWAYHKVNYEPSPANRILESYAPGAAWVGSESGTARHNVGTQYWVNTPTDAVRIWKVTNSASIDQFATYSTTATYAAGQLHKLVTTNEIGKQVIEFRNNEDVTILKKVQLTATADDGSGSDHGGWICTYYIYDDQNLLRAVLQPRAVEILPGNGWQINSTITDELSFRYEYDGLQHMVMKQVPGAKPVYMVYDRWDRLVLTQDGNLRPGQQWIFTKYDQYNRPVMTGLHYDPSNIGLVAMTNYLRSIENTLGRYETVNASLAFGYTTTQAYPSVASPNVLTVTYYDNYDWTSAINTALRNPDFSRAGEFITTYNTAPLYAQPLQAEPVVDGMITGTLTRVLGTASQFITAVHFYDSKGRVVQTKKQNATLGIDVSITQYSFNGKPLLQMSQQQKSGNNGQTLEIWTQNNYDDLWRITQTAKRVRSTAVNGNALGPWITISQNKYDALGRLASKTIGNKPGAGTPLATLDYQYNIRDWMLSINKDYLSTGGTDRYFGMQLGYDQDGVSAFANKQFNGNIAGTIWKSQGDQQQRKYDYSYDAANRLLKADFTDNVGYDFNMKVGDGVNPGAAYDVNGNIQAMWQKGMDAGSPAVIDDLHYRYAAGGNRLGAAWDNGGNPNSKLGDFTETTQNKTDNLNGTDDYAYDDNGNLTADKNKNITQITYNYLSLPLLLAINYPDGTPKGTISYTYDAAGNKLSKVITELPSTANSNVGKTTTTTYLNGAVFEEKAFTDGTPAIPPTLQFIPHEEGRIRFEPATTSTCPAQPDRFVWDYFIRDHLGNTRTVLTEQNETLCYIPATLEDSRQTDEQKIYNIDNSRRKDIAQINGANAYPQFASKVYTVNGGIPNQRTGLGVVLKVMAGDKVQVSVQSYYNMADGTLGQPVTMGLTELLSALAGNPLSLSHGMTAGTLSGLQTGTGINNFVNSHAEGATRPKAYLNYMLFDNQFKYLSGDVDPVVGNGGYKMHTAWATGGIPIASSGYLYIFVSNESNIPVYFDNLAISHTPGPLLEETHYYPFGLTMAGISDKALKANYTENKYKFNGGNELQNKEFSDGSGLELYDARNRMYDPQIGRFGEIDPMGDMSQNMSSYVFASDNPISINDPMGLRDSLPTVVVIGYLKNKASEFTNWFTGANVGYTGSGWGHGPRRALAGLFHLGNNANNLVELGLQSQLQNTRVNLTGSLLNGLKTDPAQRAFQNKIIALLKADPRFGKLSFTIKGGEVIGFGGDRWSSKDEKWGSLSGANPLAHGETWDVAGNPLTWAVRHAEVDYTATVKSDGTIVIDYHLSDTLDLSAQKGRSEAYNNISSATGYLYHDVAGGNKDIKVNADWQSIVK